MPEPVKGWILQQLLTVWNALDVGKRIIVGGAAIAVFVAVLALANIATKPSMALLYSGLDPAVSGEVVNALDKKGVAYSVQGTAIYVDSSKRDLIRMSLAEQGLPASGTAGYELLDNLSGFGTTAQMFDATYWRAKEGELARTILAWPQIKSVRVHIANPGNRPFARPTTPVASVTVRLSSGTLSPARARALRFLIASAVAGLAPENVSIIDSDRGLVDPQGAAGQGQMDPSGLAAKLKKNVENLLVARVGPGNAVVEVTVDSSREKETIVERKFDPNTRVAISSDTEETTGSSSDGGSPSVTVASNLPSGSKGGAGTSAKSASTKTRERINYDVSETTRKLVKQPGKINRISVAVLINGIVDAKTGTWTPRPKAEIASLLELVQSAVGYTANRGDIVTIKSLEFRPPDSAGTLAVASVFSPLFANSVVIMQSGILALVILGLGLFVLRPILTSRALTALPGPALTAIAGGSANSMDPHQLALAMPNSAQNSAGASDPVAQLREIISGRQEEAVDILRNWIETSEEQV